LFFVTNNDKICYKIRGITDGIIKFNWGWSGR